MPSGELPTVQGTLENAFHLLCGVPVQVTASSRTDRGVHALDQVIHCEPPEKLRSFAFLRVLNQWLPNSIVIHKAYSAPRDFHAIKSAAAKYYRYRINTASFRSPFRARYSTWIRGQLDLDYLNNLSRCLIGAHDFKSFQSVGTMTQSSIRCIYRAQWVQKSVDIVEFQIIGSGFLKQMVRNIVGTLLEFESDRRLPHQFSEILIQRDRRLAGAPAPPQGLILDRVFYPEAIERLCVELDNW